MVHIKGLSNFFWIKDIRIDVHVLNRYPKRNLDNTNPYECWLGKNPSVKHFRIFSCVAYVHVNGEHIKKLGAKSERHIFISYSEHSKDYTFFNLFSHKFVVSIDAKGEVGSLKKDKIYLLKMVCLKKLLQITKEVFIPAMFHTIKCILEIIFLIHHHKWDLLLHHQVHKMVLLHFHH